MGGVTAGVIGRSPRTRGRLTAIVPSDAEVRSIPAYAGETAGRGTLRSRAQVDPRVRGGDCRIGSCRARGLGRSPRTRGRPKPRTRPSYRPRSIPAYAGETAQSGWISAPQWVDPRVRGGDISSIVTLDPSPGRSPRTRGRPLLVIRHGGYRGSIPAYAGETSGVLPGCSKRRVDPRVRGGDMDRSVASMKASGRSPRTRGRPPT